MADFSPDVMRFMTEHVLITRGYIYISFFSLFFLSVYNTANMCNMIQLGHSQAKVYLISKPTHAKTNLRSLSVYTVLVG